MRCTLMLLLLLSICYGAANIDSMALKKVRSDSAFITSGKISRLWYGIEKGDTAYSTIDTNQFNKSDSAIFGTGTNNSTFEKDGTLIFKGSATVWEDVNLGSFGLGAGATAPDPVQVGSSGIYLRGFDGGSTTEQLFFELEIPHTYDEGTPLYFHIHTMPSTADTGTAKWQLAYIIDSTGDSVSTATTITKTQRYDSTAWQRYFTEFDSITGSFKIGDQIIARLFRNPGDAADTYGSDALIETVGFHYRRNSVGSRNRTSK